MYKRLLTSAAVAVLCGITPVLQGCFKKTTTTTTSHENLDDCQTNKRNAEWELHTAIAENKALQREKDYAFQRHQDIIKTLVADLEAEKEENEHASTQISAITKELSTHEKNRDKMTADLQSQLDKNEKISNEITALKHLRRIETDTHEIDRKKLVADLADVQLQYQKLSVDLNSEVALKNQSRSDLAHANEEILTLRKDKGMLEQAARTSKEKSASDWKEIQNLTASLAETEEARRHLQVDLDAAIDANNVCEVTRRGETSDLTHALHAAEVFNSHLKIDMDAQSDKAKALAVQVSDAARHNAELQQALADNQHLQHALESDISHAQTLKAALAAHVDDMKGSLQQEHASKILLEGEVKKSKVEHDAMQTALDVRLSEVKVLQGNLADQATLQSVLQGKFDVMVANNAEKQTLFNQCMATLDNHGDRNMELCKMFVSVVLLLVAMFLLSHSTTTRSFQNQLHQIIFWQNDERPHHGTPLGVGDKTSGPQQVQQVQPAITASAPDSEQQGVVESTNGVVHHGGAPANSTHHSFTASQNVGAGHGNLGHAYLQGAGYENVVDHAYVQKLLEMLDEPQPQDLLSAILLMKKYIWNAATQPSQAFQFGDDNEWLSYLTHFAESECEDSFVRCYTFEDPPIYRIVADCFHDRNRMGDGELSQGVKACAPFYRGLNQELNGMEHIQITAWRGVPYHFRPFNSHFEPGKTEVCFYEPRSATTSMDTAWNFATRHGTIFKLILKRAVLIAQLSKFPSESEVLVPMLSVFIVKDAVEINDGPNEVTLEQIS